jgi:1-acyl-sn-glycerol-3-phosphate acyltransferase
MDPLALAHYIYEAGRWPQFLGKVSVFRIPLVGRILLACKQIPVYRGTADAARSLVDSAAAIGRGELVIIYPEGTTPKSGDFWPMKGKTGIARLYLQTGAPVVPVLSWGTQRLFDPREGHRGMHLRWRRTPVTLVAGPPIDLSRWDGAEPTGPDLHGITDEIMDVLHTMMVEIRGEQPEADATAQRDGAA